LKDWIVAELAERLRLYALFHADEGLVEAVEAIAKSTVEVLRRGGKVLLCGNGGSAADAQHLAAEFVSRYRFDRAGLPALSLTTDTSALTAIGNDYGFERLFARQVEALGHAGDILYAFSTSGRSPNVLLALKTARELGIGTVGFTGQSGGEMAGLCDIAFVAPSETTAHIQELHMTAGHTICGLVEMAMFPR
jgi:D-sedoheptulose 7-phosphate isomerase